MKFVANKYDAKDIIRIIRENSDKTQSEFAKILNVSYKTIQHYEYGKRKYSFEQLLKLANNENIIITIEDKN